MVQAERRERERKEREREKNKSEGKRRSSLIFFFSSFFEKKEMGVLRVYLEDNVVLRQLGLHNTFKTFPVDEKATVDVVHQKMIKQMSRGMSPAQVQVIEEQCAEYQLVEVFFLSFWREFSQKKNNFSRKSFFLFLHIHITHTKSKGF